MHNSCFRSVKATSGYLNILNAYVENIVEKCFIKRLLNINRVPRVIWIRFIVLYCVVLCCVYRCILNFVTQIFLQSYVGQFLSWYCIHIENLDKGPNIRQINNLKLYFVPSFEFVVHKIM